MLFASQKGGGVISSANLESERSPQEEGESPTTNNYSYAIKPGDHRITISNLDRVIGVSKTREENNYGGAINLS